MSTATRDKIIAYLGQGIQQSIVATSCGVTPAYVSQLLELEEVRLEVAAIRAKQLDSAVDTDSSIERIEKMALKAIESKLTFVRSAIEAAKIFQILNNAKRKTSSTDQASDALAAQQVTVVIPRGAAIHFKLNDSNQVIEVEGRTMAPLPSKALPALQKRLASRSPAADTSIMDVAMSVPRILKVPASAAAGAAASATAFAAKKEASDSARATGILRDLTMHLNGVDVVL